MFKGGTYGRTDGSTYRQSNHTNRVPLGTLRVGYPTNNSHRSCQGGSTGISIFPAALLASLPIRPSPLPILSPLARRSARLPSSGWYHFSQTRSLSNYPRINLTCDCRGKNVAKCCIRGKLYFHKSRIFSFDLTANSGRQVGKNGTHSSTVAVQSLRLKLIQNILLERRTSGAHKV